MTARVRKVSKRHSPTAAKIAQQISAAEAAIEQAEANNAATQAAMAETVADLQAGVAAELQDVETALNEEMPEPTPEPTPEPSPEPSPAPDQPPLSAREQALVERTSQIATKAIMAEIGPLLENLQAIVAQYPTQPSGGGQVLPNKNPNTFANTEGLVHDMGSQMANLREERIKQLVALSNSWRR